MDRVLLGKKIDNSPSGAYKTGIISYIPSTAYNIPGFGSAPTGKNGIIVLTETDFTKIQVGDLIIFPPIAAGDQYLPQERRVITVQAIGYGEGSVSAGSYAMITVSGLNIEGGALLVAPRNAEVVSYMNSIGGIAVSYSHLRAHET